MIENLLPPWVSVVETDTDASQDLLWPAELEMISRSVAKRRAEFTTVRVCARTALAGLGVAPAPILSGAHGEPIWPEHVIGSMTHCDGYRAAAVAEDRVAAAIGIDAEPHARLPNGVLRLIASPEDQRQLESLAVAVPLVHWDRVLFSIKESVYKAWFPLTARWVDFLDASVTADPDEGTFVAHMQAPGPVLYGRELTDITGRFAISEQLVVTAIAIPADPDDVNPPNSSQPGQ